MSYRFVPKSSTALTDNSWIKHRTDQDDDLNRDPNFVRQISKPSENSVSDDDKTTQTTRTTTSVKALTNKFGGGQDDSWGSTSPTSRTSSTTTRMTKNGSTETTTTTTTKNLSSPTKTFTDRVRTSSQGPQYSAYSPTRTTKVTDTAITSPKDAENELYNTLIPTSISRRPSSTTYSPSSKVTEITYTTNKSGEDKLFDTDIPSTVKDILSPTDRNQYSTYSSSRTTTTTTVTSKGAEDVTDLTPYKDDFKPTDSSRIYSSTETVTVKSSPDANDDIKTTTLTRTPSKPVDDLYSNLLPKGITSLPSSSESSSSIRKREIVTVESSKGGDDSTYSSPSSNWRTSSYNSYDDIPSTVTTSYSTSTTPSDNYSRETTTTIYSKPSPSYEYSSVTSPTAYPSSPYRSSSMSDDNLADQLSKSSRESVYATPKRTVLEKDLCTICRKPLNDDPKMVLDDIKIRCHASCFKCDVCNSTLGNLKAGDSLWMYRNMVHCENCFEVTRDKWHR